MHFLAFLVLAAAFTATNACLSQPEIYQLYENRTFLTIPKGKAFKILQIADIHYANGKSTGCQDILDSQLPCSDSNSTAWIAKILQLERPNLVVFSGDNIMGSDSVNHRLSMKAILRPLEVRKVPFMMVFGNHDDEMNSLKKPVANLRHKLMEIAKESPYCLADFGPSCLHGVGNYAYAVRNSAGNQTHSLYLMDSSSYDVTGTVGGYDWMRGNQVYWFNQTSYTTQQALGGKQVPGVLFHHIPQPEHELAWHCNKGTTANPITFTGFGNPDGYMTESGIGLFAKYKKNPTTGLSSCPAAKDQCTGVKQEGVYSASVNAGLWSAIIDRGDVKMVNVGHDHVDDFCCPLGPTGVQMCYGGGFGYHAYGQAGWPRRARVITLHEDGTIESYKRLDAFSTPPYTIIDRQTIYQPTM